MVMRWGDKITKDELKEAGLDLDAFQAAMDKTKQIDELNTKMAKMQEGIDGLTSIKDSLSGLENKLKDLGKSANTNGNGNGNSNTDGNNSGDGGNKDEVLDWVLEPEKATQATIMKTIGPMAGNLAEMRATMNVTNFKSTNPKGFRKYETEIMEMFNKQPLASRMLPDLIANCYKVVIANHVDEISKGGESFFLETGGNSTNNNEGPKKKAEDILSKDQLKLCEQWGVTPEDYLKELQAGGATAYA